MTASEEKPHVFDRNEPLPWAAAVALELERANVRRDWVDARIRDARAAPSGETIRGDAQPGDDDATRQPSSLESNSFAHVGPRPTDLVGLALSGGGIRSATFSAGVLSSLSRHGLTHRLDYLSTVSGGGYAGAFFCSLFVPDALRGSVPDMHEHCSAASARGRILGGSPLESLQGKRAIGQLRQTGNYLTPAGATDTVFTAIIALRNWVAVFLVSGLAILLVFLTMNVARIAIPIVASGLGLGDEAVRWIENVVTSPRAMLACQGGQAINLQLDCLSAALGDPRLAFGSSYLWVISLLLIPTWILPSCWAYWMVPTGTRERFPLKQVFNLMIATALLSAGVLFAIWLVEARLSASGPFFLAEICGSILGILFYVAARIRVRRDAAGHPYREYIKGAASDAPRVARENRIRAKISRWLYRGAIVFGTVSALAFVDDLGRWIYLELLDRAGASAGGPSSSSSSSAAAVGAIAATMASIRWLLAQAQSTKLLDGSKIWPAVRRSLHGIALVSGIIILAGIMAAWASISYELVWHHEPITIDGPPPRFGSVAPLYSIAAPIFMLGFIAVLVFSTGKADGFLNHSSLASLYAGRLRKAYLGATNRARDKVGADDPNGEHPRDDIHLRAYYHPSVQCPIHLINVTVNETTSKSSSVIQRDRKGKNLTISPAGFIVSLGAPTDDPVAFSLSEGEELPLSTWIAISGAAISTGMGQHTTLGQSLLAALVNLRLGYWWDSPRGSPWTHGGSLFWNAMTWLRGHIDDLVQSYLLREARAKYEGTHTNRWYLSDGGHYENMAVYELVRRRIGFIIACDNGADPAYEFSDLVNLIRKARIDFDADTVFLGDSELDHYLGRGTALRAAFGTLEQISRSDAAPIGSSSPYAALARINYLGQRDRDARTPPSTLLLMKPRLGSTDLPDLVRYKAKSSSFPQQPTTDQTFDEPQWESYFRLGQIISDTIFDRPPVAPAGVRGGTLVPVASGPTRWWWPWGSKKIAAETCMPGPDATDYAASSWWPFFLERLPDQSTHRSKI